MRGNMRLSVLPLTLPLLVSGLACAQEKPQAAATPAPAPTPAATATRPPDLVTYRFGLIRKGPKWTPEQTPETQKIQEGHMANIRRLAEAGSLVAAGPVEAAEGSDLRGIFVFKGVSREEAQKLADGDPAVQAGRLRLEFLDFVGTSGIGRRYREEKAKAGAAFKDEMVQYQLVLFKPGIHYKAEEQGENATLGQLRRTWMENLLKQGKVLLAGPFGGGGAYTGLFVLNAGSREAADALLKEDPTVKTNRAAYELHGWWVARGVVD